MYRDKTECETWSVRDAVSVTSEGACPVHSTLRKRLFTRLLKPQSPVSTCRNIKARSNCIAFKVGLLKNRETEKHSVTSEHKNKFRHLACLRSENLSDTSL